MLTYAIKSVNINKEISYYAQKKGLKIYKIDNEIRGGGGKTGVEKNEIGKNDIQILGVYV